MFTTMQFQVIHWLWCLLGGDTKIQNNDLGEFLTIQFCKKDAMGVVRKYKNNDFGEYSTTLLV